MARHKDTERTDIRSETRQSLLDAAAQEFAVRGYEGANINRISRAAGFAKGTVYNYFDSKRALMLALIEEVAAVHYTHIADQVLDEPDARDRLARFFAAGFDFVSTHLAMAKVMVNNVYGPDFELKVAMYEAYQPLFDLVGREIIGFGVATQRFRPVDAGATAALLMNVYLGTASQVDETGKTYLTPEAVSDFVWHALKRADA